MNRRRMLAMLSLAALVRPAHGLDPPARLKRVVLVRAGHEKWEAGAFENQAKKLADEGLVEGRDYKLELVDGFDTPWPPSPENVRRAKEIVATRPDVIMVGGDKIILFQSVTRDIPLVFYFLNRDPVELGLVADLRRPGGNITGAVFRFEDFIEKGLEILKELKPGAKRLGVLIIEEYDREPNYGLGPNGPQKARPVMKAASSHLGLEYVEMTASNKERFAAVERRLQAAKIDFCWCAGSWPELHPFLDRSRILTSGVNSEQVRKGALLSVGPSWNENSQNARRMVAQILRGVSPATIPIQMPSRYIIAINLKTAKEMGIKVPESVLLRANVVIDESGKERE